MADAYVYDAVRTPRGRGKKDGALHEVPAVRLGAKVLEAHRDRNGLDTSTVDDIIFGCVDPVGEVFNPEQHQAMAMQPSTDVADGNVLKVLQKGYVLADRLVRPALVIVARTPDNS